MATLAQGLCGSGAEIHGEPLAAKHQIETDKLRSLGMEFGGRERLQQTVAQLVAAVA